MRNLDFHSKNSKFTPYTANIFKVIFTTDIFAVWLFLMSFGAEKVAHIKLTIIDGRDD